MRQVIWYREERNERDKLLGIFGVLHLSCINVGSYIGSIGGIPLLHRV